MIFDLKTIFFKYNLKYASNNLQSNVIIYVAPKIILLRVCLRLRFEINKVE